MDRCKKQENTILNVNDNRQNVQHAACNAIMQMSGGMTIDMKKHVLGKHGFEFEEFETRWNKIQPSKF